MLKLPRKWSADCAQRAPFAAPPVACVPPPPQPAESLAAQSLSARTTPTTALESSSSSASLASSSGGASSERPALANASNIPRAVSQARRENAAILIQCAYWAWVNARQVVVSGGAEQLHALAAADGPIEVEGWELVTADDGRVYYWNPETDDTCWETPPASPSPSRTSSSFGPGQPSSSGEELPQFLRERAATAPDLSTLGVHPGDESAAAAACRAKPIQGKRTQVKEKKDELRNLQMSKRVSLVDKSGIEAVLRGRVETKPKWKGLAPSAQLPPTARFSNTKRWELAAHKSVTGKSALFRHSLESALLKRASSASTEDDDSSETSSSSPGAASHVLNAKEAFEGRGSMLADPKAMRSGFQA